MCQSFVRSALSSLTLFPNKHTAYTLLSFFFHQPIYFFFFFFLYLFGWQQTIGRLGLSDAWFVCFVFFFFLPYPFRLTCWAPELSLSFFFFPSFPLVRTVGAVAAAGPDSAQASPSLYLSIPLILLPVSFYASLVNDDIWCGFMLPPLILLLYLPPAVSLLLSISFVFRKEPIDNGLGPLTLSLSLSLAPPSWCVHRPFLRLILAL